MLFEVQISNRLKFVRLEVIRRLSSLDGQWHQLVHYSESG